MKDYLIDVIERTSFISSDIDVVKVQVNDSDVVVSCMASPLKHQRASYEPNLAVHATINTLPQGLTGTFGIKHSAELYEFLTNKTFKVTSVSNNRLGFTSSATGNEVDYYFISEKRTDELSITRGFEDVNKATYESQFIVTDDFVKKVEELHAVSVSSSSALCGFSVIGHHLKPENNYFNVAASEKGLLFRIGINFSSCGETLVTDLTKHDMPLRGATLSHSKISFLKYLGVAHDGGTWRWPVILFLNIIKLQGVKTVKISSDGFIVIKCETTHATYHYVIPAHST